MRPLAPVERRVGIDVHFLSPTAAQDTDDEVRLTISDLGCWER